MQKNDDLDPKLFKIFSIGELSSIAYNLYVRSPALLEKHWKEIVKQIICKSLELAEVKNTASYIEVALVLNQDIIQESKALHSRNLLSSQEPQMLKANENMAKKIVQKCCKKPNISPIMAAKNIFDKKQGVLSKLKEKYVGYISSEIILKMYKKAIEIEFFKIYEAEQEAAKKRSEIILTSVAKKLVEKNPQSKTFQNFLTESDNKRVNEIMTQQK